MIKEELSQLYYLKKEIRHLKSRIIELECVATSTSVEITGLPKGSGVSDKVGSYGSQLADLKSLLKVNLEKCLCELNRLNRYISSIEDSEIRMILTLRYVDGQTWEQVAENISPYASGESVRKQHERFLKKVEKNNTSTLFKHI